MLHGILGYPEFGEISNLELGMLFAKLDPVQTNEVDVQPAAGEQLPASAYVKQSAAPDDPHWGLLSGVGLWLFSICLIVILPVFTVIPYAMWNDVKTDQLQEFLRADRFDLPCSCRPGGVATGR